MAITSSLKSGAFWKADWFVGVVVMSAALGLFSASDFLPSVELKFYDFATTTASRPLSDRVAVIAIDEQSIATLGPWPWPNSRYARLIDQLAEAHVKTIVQTSFLSEPQLDAGLSYIQKIGKIVGSIPDPLATDRQIADLVAEAENALDPDATLASSIRRAGNVLLPLRSRPRDLTARPESQLTAFVVKSSLQGGARLPVSTQGLEAPIDMLGNAAAGVGYLTPSVDTDGVTRTDMLWVNYAGHAVPSLALQAVVHSFNLSPSDIRLQRGESLQLDKLRIKTSPEGSIRPQFYRGKDGRNAVALDSFVDVLSGKIPASNYAGKIVVIGATAAGVGTLLSIPGNAMASIPEFTAQVISSLLSGHSIAQPWWSSLAASGVFLLVAGYVIALLPRLSAGKGAALTLGLLALFIGAEFSLLAFAATWVPLVFPALALVLGYLALNAKRTLMTVAVGANPAEESAETNRMMGLALQGQGQLDMAFERYRRAPVNSAMMDDLYNLAAEFQRKLLFTKAQSVYKYMSEFDKDYRDITTKLQPPAPPFKSVGAGKADQYRDETLLLNTKAPGSAMLGRYQLDKELGKGAMGTVFLGKDPKIGRVVAIKTMALSEEFSGDALVDARERFFREAETAGRLQHQNIVTIYDAAEDRGLAYIAMEFLKGSDLAAHCKSDNLLPVATVLGIVARVADALAYAHKQSVVHRDIKPANVMYELNSDTVKVTDFGIARITDSSKTKTGLVLGTPSFMSPEQLAGKKVDGRSDLYSLGVMLFQMLSGALPLRGDSMAELMFKIANQEAPDIRMFRPELPIFIADIVARSMRKGAEARYQDGHAFAEDLRAAMARFTADTTHMALRHHSASAATDDKTQVLTVASASGTMANFEKTMVRPRTGSPVASGGGATDLDL